MHRRPSGSKTAESSAIPEDGGSNVANTTVVLVATPIPAATALIAAELVHHPLRGHLTGRHFLSASALMDSSTGDDSVKIKGDLMAPC
ncbi:MAG TPA: hypothetical protein VN785_08400 [Candidatus Angelobacter sp.]|nr:hypothetical protein [Candidatus Angelobacter sp.]